MDPLSESTDHSASVVAEAVNDHFDELSLEKRNANVPVLPSQTTDNHSVPWKPNCLSHMELLVDQCRQQKLVKHRFAHRQVLLEMRPFSLRMNGHMYKTWSKKTLVLKPSQLHLVNDTIFNVKRTTQNGKLLLVPQRLISPFHALTYDLQSNELRKIEIKGIPKDWFSVNRRRTTYFDVILMEQSESLMSLPHWRFGLDLYVDHRHRDHVEQCCVM